MALWDEKTSTIGARVKSKSERETLLLLLIFGQRIFSELRKKKRDIEMREFLIRLNKSILNYLND